MRAIGRALNVLPDQLGMGDEDRDMRTGLVAAQCIACCYAVDVCGAIPFMQSVEQDENRYNLALFAFYEACWPCLWCARTCGVVDDARIRALTRVDFPYFHIIKGPSSAAAV
jgi:hypothetical protein